MVKISSGQQLSSQWQQRKRSDGGERQENLSLKLYAKKEKRALLISRRELMQEATRHLASKTQGIFVMLGQIN